MGAIAASVRGQSKSSEPWRRPSVTVARLTLESYVRRGWILFDVVAVVVVLVALCYPFQSATASFYGGVGLALGAVAVLGTVILARPAASARTYLVLARLPARGAYSRGLLLAAATLRVFDSLLAVALAVGTGRIVHPTLGPILVGLAALTADCIVLAALTVTLCAPIGSRRLLIAFLVWLLAALVPAYDAARLPAILSALLSLARLPLLPVSTVFAAGAGGNFDWPTLVGLAVEAVYVGALAVFAGFLLEKRELVLH